MFNPIYVKNLSPLPKLTKLHFMSVFPHPCFEQERLACFERGCCWKSPGNLSALPLPDILEN
jgi:hypothetical protein